jgi:DNA-binding YbaB/EbfC family protein
VANPQQQQMKMMRQMQKMQADMAAAQEELAAAEIEGSAGGGMVKAVVNGTGELRSISISKDVVDPDDVEMLEDLVVAAVADALRTSKAMQEQRMGAATGGLDLGSLGLGGLLG